jgi:hypothetical protein
MRAHRGTNFHPIDATMLKTKSVHSSIKPHEDGTIDRRNRTLKNHGQKFTLRPLQYLAKCQPVTLMCHCAEDESHCHRHILLRVLRGNV